jgi:hypothetical protein
VPHCQVRPIASVRWLGAVERAFAGQRLVIEAGRAQRRFEVALGPVPQRILTGADIGAQGQLDPVIGEAEIAVDRIEQRAEAFHLIDDLAVGAEDMRVVLGELADAHDAVERAMRLVAVAAAEFGEAQRQVAIRPYALAEHLDMGRAIHRLERHQVAGAA